MVHEHVQSEVDDFERKIWKGGHVYHDKMKHLYRVLGEGQINSGEYLTALFSKESMKSLKLANKELKERGLSGTLKGEGAKVFGGTLIFQRGGKIFWMQSEKKLGDRLHIQVLLKKLRQLKQLDDPLMACVRQPIGGVLDKDQNDIDA